MPYSYLRFNYADDIENQLVPTKNTLEALLATKANNTVVSKTAAGLAPQLPNESTTDKFLRQDGTWSVPAYPSFSLPIATAGQLGGVKIGSNISVTAEGVISLSSGNVTGALGFTPLNSTLKGANNGLAELDATGKVPSSQLPSYVDDVLEYDTRTEFPATGETGKIYVATDTNLTYRWGGSEYVEISPSLALGTTSSTAFRGDYGNTAYTHATAKGSAFSAVFGKVTTNAQGHVTGITAAVKADITALLAYGTVGSATKPVYFNNGAPTACTYTLGKSVPADAVFTDTTYTVFVKSGTGAASGLVPAPPTTAGTTKYLREDGTWVAPPNTTYSVATTSTNGLMSSAMVTKLNGIANGATANAASTVTPKVAGTAAVGTDAGFARGDHVHPVQTTVQTANQVGTADVGTTITPIYLKAGVPTALGYTIAKSVPSNAVFTDTWVAFKGATTSAAGTAGYAPAPTAGAANRYLRSDGTWTVPPNTNTWIAFKGATASAAGTAGYVPAPTAGDVSRYFAADGTWKPSVTVELVEL